MQSLAPLGPVYQAGTLSGNPLALAAGLETLEALAEAGAYGRLEALSRLLEEGLAESLRRLGRGWHLNRVGSMLSLFFTGQPVTDYESARTADTRLYSAWFAGMLRRGVYLAPSQFEAAFLSLAHTAEDVARTVEAHYLTLKELL